MDLPLIPTAASLSLSDVPSLPRPTRNITTAQMLLLYAFNVALVLMYLELSSSVNYSPARLLKKFSFQAKRLHAFPYFYKVRPSNGVSWPTF